MVNFTLADHPKSIQQDSKMHLMYFLDDRGNRVYTLKVSVCLLVPIFSGQNGSQMDVCSLQKVDPEGAPTHSAHPARFSPDDKFSRERITCKKRFNQLPTQVSPFLRFPCLPLPDPLLAANTHCLLSTEDHICTKTVFMWVGGWMVKRVTLLIGCTPFPVPVSSAIAIICVVIIRIIVRL